MRVYKAEDLGFDREKLENRQIVILFPHRIQRECKFVEGNSPQEKGENLAMRLKEEGVIYKH
jgi:hypothetical protein